MNKTQYILGEILFYVHIPISVIWFVLFFVPLSWWPSRIIFHFYFIMSMVGAQVLGGIVYYPIIKKFDLRCPLTIIMQWVRGYRCIDEKAYSHLFVVEFFERLHMKPQKNTVTLLIIISIIIVTCQYFFISKIYSFLHNHFLV